MTPVIGEVYDVPGQSTLLEIIATNPETQDSYNLIVYKVNRLNHTDTVVDEISIKKSDFEKATKVDI